MSYDVDKFILHLRSSAHKTGYGNGQCALFVRKALNAGGANTSGHPTPAKEWGPTLERNAFHEVPVGDLAAFTFLKGDIVIIQPPTHGRPEGHIAAFDGKTWVSDFVQREFWPGPGYRKEKPSYVLYRR